MSDGIPGDDMAEKDTGIGDRVDPVVKLPMPPGMVRVESSPIQFGDDWPGCFLRGDDCAHLAMVLDEAAKLMMKKDPIHGVLLKSYTEFFQSSRSI